MHVLINHTYDVHSFVDEIHFKETRAINLTSVVDIFTKMSLHAALSQS
jgi:hypothetical protein